MLCCPNYAASFSTRNDARAPEPLYADAIRHVVACVPIHSASTSLLIDSSSRLGPIESTIQPTAQHSINPMNFQS